MRGLFRALAGTLLLGSIVLGATGCLEQVDPAELDPSLSAKDYKIWGMRVQVARYIPGHKDTVRQIYVNPVARAYPHSGVYPPGSVIVKEIYHRDENGLPTTLDYIAIMRKPATRVPVDTYGGWIWSFTEDASTVESEGKEDSWDGCWKTCHQQSSFDGAWADYGD